MEKIILGLLVVGAGVIIGFPKVRQALRIKINNAAEGSTSAIERLEDTYESLLAKLPKQKQAVAKAQAGASDAQKQLVAAEAALVEIEERHSTALGLGASEEALGVLEDQYSEQEALIEELKANAQEASKLAGEALKALEATAQKLKKFEREVESAGRKAELTEAYRVANQVSAELGTINSSLSKAGQAARQVDMELETARAESQLNQGSAGEIELAELEAKQRRASVRSKLRQKAGLSDSNG
ncbi:MAG: hypothetical protein HY986_07845 [Candidatus Melainabacteria bacterium]|nr:hypothetical protein [Candidatus Melainabacteria bacterium]